MLNYFTRNSSPPPGPPTIAPTTMATTYAASDDDSGLPLPPPHIIHSPLPSRPSPTQPAHVLDALLRGAHAGSSASPAPTTESSTTSFSAHHVPISHPATPQSFNNLQPAQSQPDRGMDLLAMLTSAANASQSQLQQPQPAQPQPPRLPVDDPKIAGRMILDSLLKYVPFSVPDLPRTHRDAEHAVVQLFAAGLTSCWMHLTITREHSTTLSSSSIVITCILPSYPHSGALGAFHVSPIYNISSIDSNLFPTRCGCTSVPSFQTLAHRPQRC